jgi:hypothetical protein
LPMVSRGKFLWVIATTLRSFTAWYFAANISPIQQEIVTRKSMPILRNVN